MMSALAVPFMIAGTAMQVVSGIQQGKIAEANAKAEAATLEANAMAKRAEAAEKARYYGQQALKAKRAGRALLSKAQASFTAGGVTPNAVVLAQINQDTADEIYELQRAGSMAYSTGMWEADWMNQMAAYNRKIGKYQKRSSYMSAFGTGLTGTYITANMMRTGSTTLTGNTWGSSGYSMQQVGQPDFYS